MTWKDILKAPLSEREMAEVREFMPEEMESGSIQNFPRIDPVKIPKVITPLSELERRLQSFRNAPPGLQRRSALQLLRDAAEKAGMPDAATKSPPEIVNFVREMKVRNKGDRSNSGTAA
jgi:hypothetical protein|tara:strand:+ start:221 stop:577 length:357 start_codon:yes stop_codon:yes gene_type:complete